MIELLSISSQIVGINVLDRRSQHSTLDHKYNATKLLAYNNWKRVFQIVIQLRNCELW